MVAVGNPFRSPSPTPSDIQLAQARPAECVVKPPESAAPLFWNTGAEPLGDTLDV